jgi:hypothetical protein
VALGAYTEAQVARALRNYLVDLSRGWLRERRHVVAWADDETGNSAAAPEVGLAAGSAAEAIRPRREGVETLASLLDGPVGLDYGAAVLLSERIKVLVAAASEVEEGGLPPPPSRIAEAFYPWRAEIERRRIRPGAPELRSAWRAIADGVDKAPEVRLRDPRVAEVLLCTVAVWQQWVSRGRRMIEERIDPVELEQLVPTWRRSRRGGRG